MMCRVDTVWAFKNNALFWSRLIMPSNGFYLENTSMLVYYILKYGYAADLIRGWVVR